jgi:hypothetical protein
MRSELCARRQRVLGQRANSSRVGLRHRRRGWQPAVSLGHHLGGGREVEQSRSPTLAGTGTQLQSLRGVAHCYEFLVPILALPARKQQKTLILTSGARLLPGPAGSRPRVSAVRGGRRRDSALRGGGEYLKSNRGVGRGDEAVVTRPSMPLTSIPMLSLPTPPPVCLYTIE